jgi:hypothetical protein
MNYTQSHFIDLSPNTYDHIGYVFSLVLSWYCHGHSFQLCLKKSLEPSEVIMPEIPQSRNEILCYRNEL